MVAELKSRWIVSTRRTLCRDQGLVTRLIWQPLMTQTRFTKPPLAAFPPLSPWVLLLPVFGARVMLFATQV